MGSLSGYIFLLFVGIGKVHPIEGTEGAIEVSLYFLFYHWR